MDNEYAPSENDRVFIPVEKVMRLTEQMQSKMDADWERNKVKCSYCGKMQPIVSRLEGVNVLPKRPRFIKPKVQLFCSEACFWEWAKLATPLRQTQIRNQ